MSNSASTMSPGSAQRRDRARAPWRVWIDTGGTFTDCCAVSPEGTEHRAKVLSTSAVRVRLVSRTSPTTLVVEGGEPPEPMRGASAPRRSTLPPGFFNSYGARFLSAPHSPGRVVISDSGRGVIELNGPVDADIAAGAALELLSPEEAPILAARIVTGTPLNRPLPPIDMRLATTRGTNALLERKGAPVALFVTRGFADLLVIGTQQRPDLFALDIIKPEPLHAAAVEVEERLAADGSVVRPLDLAPLAARADELAARGVRAAAVALLHSWVNPEHERRVRAFLLERGFTHVTCSAELSPVIKVLPRAQTAVVNAYLSSVIETYLSRVREGLGGGRLHVMTSAGGLARAESFAPRDSLLSGPAGGVVGASLAARRSGAGAAIGFDMGGTSTDVARIADGAAFDYVFEHAVGDVRIVGPALAVHTVAAGGGSICVLEGGRARVGPESAGASPGPACYGCGGPLTITDCNLLLGRVDPARFGIPIERGPASERLAEMTGKGVGPRIDERGAALLEGFLDIANERMADAIRRVSIRAGYDAAEHAMIAFGGAGGQHACAVAARLGITRVVVPADAGLLSALGLGHAAVERVAELQVLRTLDELGDGLAALVAELEARATAGVIAEGVDARAVRVSRRILNLRLLGQETSLAVDWRPGESAAALFDARYRDVYGHEPAARVMEVESVRVVARSAEVHEGSEEAVAILRERAVPARSARARFGGAWVEAGVFERASLRPGAGVEGPALILEDHGTTVVEPGWSARVDGAGAVVMESQRREPAERAAAREGRPEEVRHELLAGRLEAIARDMGEQLQRTALSVNVKERLDFSCAILDGEGELVVNAPHVPVHLGALGVCVRAVRAAVAMEPGDAVVTNHPAFGGSHLPDITVITPVFAAAGAGGAPVAYIASRAHHAEIGGTRPGSMPPDARSLAEEGAVIAPMHLVRAGGAEWDAVRRVLEAGPFPSRAVDDNLADLRAQVAANTLGRAALEAMTREWGPEALREGMRALGDRAERATRGALDALLAGGGERAFSALERLDDGTPIAASIRVGRGASGAEAVIDFAGTGGVHPGNLNATPAIVRSAVVYVLRLLVGGAMPLNEGIMRAVGVRVPRGLLDPEFGADPARCPAVAGGNTETSQRVVDALLGALGLAACSQGTMNNVLFGDDRFGYYETVCGGAGATERRPGADAVHTHMTNTRITDPEVLEHRYPVRLERFAVRKGSGGRGAKRGGDGVIREYLFLRAVSVSILSQRRTAGPGGLAGGGAGAAGAQRVVRADGRVERLGAVAACECAAGDRLVLETPGGGGWGAEIGGAT